MPLAGRNVGEVNPVVHVICPLLKSTVALSFVVGFTNGNDPVEISLISDNVAALLVKALSFSLILKLIIVNTRNI